MVLRLVTGSRKVVANGSMFVSVAVSEVIIVALSSVEIREYFVAPTNICDALAESIHALPRTSKLAVTVPVLSTTTVFEPEIALDTKEPKLIGAPDMNPTPHVEGNI